MGSGIAIQCCVACYHSGLCLTKKKTRNRGSSSTTTRIRVTVVSLQVVTTRSLYRLRCEVHIYSVRVRPQNHRHRISKIYSSIFSKSPTATSSPDTTETAVAYLACSHPHFRLSGRSWLALPNSFALTFALACPHLRLADDSEGVR